MKEYILEAGGVSLFFWSGWGYFLILGKYDRK